MNLQSKLLTDLSNREFLVSNEYAKEIDQEHQVVVGAIKSLESLGDVIKVEQSTVKTYSLTKEGEDVCENGSLEARLFYSLPAEGLPIEKLQSKFEKCNIAIGQCMKLGWIKKNGQLIEPQKTEIEDVTKKNLLIVKEGGNINKPDEYKKRNLVALVPLTIFKIKKGENFNTSVKKQITELTKDMIEKGTWKDASFKPVNFEAMGKLQHRCGYLHPLMQLRDEFRKVFMQMGFTEMETNNYVESAFWNFDALFQPQKHPARDAQDTFYVSDPERTLEVPQKYLEKVKKVHSVGDYGSTGYRSPWSVDEAHKNLLRTHTTAVTARVLQNMAKNKEFKPFKYFSIDKVYRNETLDATHLAEFFQVEGIMGDYNLSMKHLMGTFSTFYKKIGINNIKFKPAYNPYTEPSMEIFAFHEGLKKWIELGNSGMFRPEMLRTMGLPENATVFGWGLSLERPAMIMYDMNNIRDLVGPKCKLDLHFEHPVCTIDKFGRKHKSVGSLSSVDQRQKSILKKLDLLSKQVGNLSTNQGCSSTTGCASDSLLPESCDSPVDATIYANPTNPPNSLAFLMILLRSKVLGTCYTYKHSSVKEAPQASIWKKIEKFSACNGKLNFRIVWHSKYSSSWMITSNSRKVFGEVSICRYVCRLMETNNGLPIYEKFPRPVVTLIDYFLDTFQSCLEKPNKKDIKPMLGMMEKSLGQSKYLCGESLSVADIVGISWLMSNNLLENDRLSTWVQQCKQNEIISAMF